MSKQSEKHIQTTYGKEKIRIFKFCHHLEVIQVQLS